MILADVKTDLTQQELKELVVLNQARIDFNISCSLLHHFEIHSFKI